MTAQRHAVNCSRPRPVEGIDLDLSIWGHKIPSTFLLKLRQACLLPQPLSLVVLLVLLVLPLVSFASICILVPPIVLVGSLAFSFSFLALLSAFRVGGISSKVVVVAFSTSTPSKASTPVSPIQALGFCSQLGVPSGLQYDGSTGGGRFFQRVQLHMTSSCPISVQHTLMKT